MQIKKNTHDAVVHNYFNAVGDERKHYRKGTSIFFEDDTLFSFGSHHMLAVKCKNGYLINNDFYSGVTRGHQSTAEWAARSAKVNHAEISMTALDKANIDPKSVHILDTGESSTLVRCKRRRFLYTRDKTAKHWTAYVFAELKKRRIFTVEQAKRNLMENFSDEQYQKLLDDKIKQQKRFYLEPHPELETRDMKKNARDIPVGIDGIKAVVFKTHDITGSSPNLHDLVLDDVSKDQMKIIQQGNISCCVILDPYHVGMNIPEDAVVYNNQFVTLNKMARQYNLGGDHVARDAIRLRDGLYVRGTLRNSKYDMVRMGNVWHKVCGDSAVGFWEVK